jgi:hypothetical protein
MLPIAQNAGWGPKPVWTLWQREKSLVPAGNQTPTIQLVALRYIHWAKMAHIVINRMSISALQ